MANKSMSTNTTVADKVTDETVEKGTSTFDADKFKKENEELKKQLDEQSKSFNEQLEAIKQMLAQQQQPATNIVENNRMNQYSDYDTIRPDKYIKVMSLTPNLLVLNAGNGKFYRFPKFGNYQNIMYGDLVNIVHNHFGLSTKGGFYIFDERAVDLTGLKEAYTTIMTKEAIDAVLEKDAKEIKNLLSTVSDFQKSAIADYLINLIVDGQDFSTSKIDVIREMSGRDIILAVDEMKNFDNEVAENEKR